MTWLIQFRPERGRCWRVEMSKSPTAARLARELKKHRQFRRANAVEVEYDQAGGSGTIYTGDGYLKAARFFIRAGTPMVVKR